MLLEGAKFADANGFVAVWTPERHFHAFGGPYPNPAVTGAAVAAVTRFALIDAAWHQPLRQRMVVLRGAPPAAHAFYEYLATPAAQAVLARYGFEAPR